jgi:peptidyl-prolyl cis-trans isomerase D
VSLTDKEIREFYDINPARFPANTAKDGIAKTELSLAATPGVNPDADFAAARPRVEEALRADRAKRRAARAASELSLALYEAKITPATLAGFLGARKLAERALQPFAAGQGPAELGGSAKIGAEAFKLGADRVFSDVVESPDGYAILVFKELQPARPARLSEIRARLEADYIAGQKRGLFAEAGARLKRHIEERLKAGDSFEAAATSGAGLLSGAKVSVKNFGKFTLRNPPEGLSPAMFAALEDIRQGQVADMVTGGETQDGLIAYAAERKEPAVDPQSPQFAQMRARIGQLLAAQSLNEQINLLLQKELAKVIPE